MCSQWVRTEPRPTKKNDVGGSVSHFINHLPESSSPSPCSSLHSKMSTDDPLSHTTTSNSRLTINIPSNIQTANINQALSPTEQPRINSSTLPRKDSTESRKLLCYLIKTIHERTAPPTIFETGVDNDCTRARSGGGRAGFDKAERQRILDHRDKTIDLVEQVRDVLILSQANGLLEDRLVG